jgi:hypothetical protein
MSIVLDSVALTILEAFLFEQKLLLNTLLLVFGLLLCKYFHIPSSYAQLLEAL